MIFGWKEEKKERDIINMLCQVLSSLRLHLSIIIIISNKAELLTRKYCIVFSGYLFP